MTPPIVRVLWEDAYSTNVWTVAEADVVPCMVLTVGYLLKRDKRHVVVAQSVGDNDMVADLIIIPSGMVRAIEILVEGDVDSQSRGSVRRGVGGRGGRPSPDSSQPVDAIRV